MADQWQERARQAQDEFAMKMPGSEFNQIMGGGMTSTSGSLTYPMPPPKQLDERMAHIVGDLITARQVLDRVLGTSKGEPANEPEGIERGLVFAVDQAGHLAQTINKLAQELEARIGRL
jgi:hypothetical protein